METLNKGTMEEMLSTPNRLLVGVQDPGTWTSGWRVS